MTNLRFFSTFDFSQFGSIQPGQSDSSIPQSASSSLDYNAGAQIHLRSDSDYDNNGGGGGDGGDAIPSDLFLK